MGRNIYFYRRCSILGEMKFEKAQGLIKRLPCRERNMVYTIEVDEENFDSFICRKKICKREFEQWMLPLIGRCVFLTEKEAEEALKGGENYVGDSN